MKFVWVSLGQNLLIFVELSLQLNQEPTTDWTGPWRINPLIAIKAPSYLGKKMHIESRASC